jgi:uncharacterized delta-60 repeat protein
MRNANSLTASQFYEFGVFRLDPDAEELFVDSQAVRLAPKVLRCLIVLVESNGKTITKGRFFEKVWPDTFVEDNALSFAISQLRKGLSEFDKDTIYIETVPRRGFRFVAEVRKIVPPETDEIILQRHTVEEVWLEESTGSEPNNYRQVAAVEKKRRFWIALMSLLFVAVAGAGGFFYFRDQAGAKRDIVPPSALAPKHSFADDGKVTTDFGYRVEKARAVAVQSDGKIVVGGWAGETEGTSEFAIARYTELGELDGAFGRDGKVITAIGAHSDVIYAVAIQPDGKIVAAGVSFGGEATRRFCVVRYKPDGALDAAFDSDGIVTLNIGTNQRDTAYAVALQPDGKVVVAGSSSSQVVADGARFPSNDFGLIRLNADGSSDDTFGKDGAVTTNFGYGVDIAYAVALQPDGKIVAGGHSTNGSNNDFSLARYNSDGTMDDAFGTGGKVRTDFFAADDMITSLTLQPDGKIVVAGYAQISTVADFALARYTEDGSLDNSFNGNGKVTLDIDEGYDVALGVKIQPDGKIVVGGQANARNSPEFAFARFSIDGKIDESFGRTGKSRISFEKPGEAWGLVLLPNGYALSVGTAGDSKLSDFAMARVPLD